MTLQSEVERIRAASRQFLVIVIALALAFAVGIAVKEIADSRAAGAAAATLTFAAFGARAAGKRRDARASMPRARLPAQGVDPSDRRR